MQGSLHLSTTTTTTIATTPTTTTTNLATIPNNAFPPSHLHFSLSAPQPKTLTTTSNSPKPTISLPKKKPSKPTTATTSTSTSDDFQEKMLYLESLGFDVFDLLSSYPPIISASLYSLKSVVEFISSIGFSPPEFRRICGMCPEILTSRVSNIVPVLTFLLREARVNGSALRSVINRRPRLLVSSVEGRLRPTLYFLQSIGICEVHKHTSLLSCSVEDKFMPRIEYLQKMGFSYKDTMLMIRRFPQLLCYSIKDNLEPKFNYFVVEMGRDLKELKEFPQYFSFNLENRIKPRHQCCVEKGVCFPLPTMLKTSDEKFRDRLEVCCNSSIPYRKSPLWCTNCEVDST